MGLTLGREQREKDFLKLCQGSNEQVKGTLGSEQGTQYCHVTLRRYKLWASRDNGAPSATCQLPSVHGLATRSSTGNKCASMPCMPLQHSNSAPLRWEFWPRGRKRADKISSHCCEPQPADRGALHTTDSEWRLLSAPQQIQQLIRVTNRVGEAIT